MVGTFFDLLTKSDTTQIFIICNAYIAKIDHLTTLLLKIIRSIPPPSPFVVMLEALLYMFTRV